MPDSPTIYVIEPVGAWGGCDYYDISLCRAMARAGGKVVWCTSEHTPRPADLNFELRYAFCGVFGSDPKWLRGFRYLRGLLQTLARARKEGAAVWHFHFYEIGRIQLASVQAARAWGRRVVITAHDVVSFAENGGSLGPARKAYALADRVIAHNRFSRDELVNRLGVAEDKIRVIPHGHHLEQAEAIPEPAEARAKLGLDPEATLLLFFGHIKEVKGLDLLLEALPDVVKAFPEVRLVIAGKAWKSDFSKYEAQINRLGLAEACILRNHHIEEEDITRYFSAADLVVLPYRRIYQSGVLMMAMSYAKPILASDLPGMREVVIHGETGWLFESENPKALEEALISALSNPAEMECLAQRGRDHMRTAFDWDRIGEKTLAVYRELTD